MIGLENKHRKSINIRLKEEVKNDRNVNNRFFDHYPVRHDVDRKDVNITIQKRPKVPSATYKFLNICLFDLKWIIDASSKLILGSGGEGTVISCWRKSKIFQAFDGFSNNKWCAKIIDLNKYKKRYRNKVILKIKKEYELIIKYGLMEIEDIYYDSINNLIVIVMEQLSHTLDDIGYYIKEYNMNNNYNDGFIKYKDKDFLCRLSFELALNIKILHDLNYIHCDIKGSNTMYNEKENRWKFIDYGLYHKLNNDKIIINGFYGSIGWNAPEISINKNGGKSIISKAMDIYSFGLLLLNVIEGGGEYGHWISIIYHLFGHKELKLNHLKFFNSKIGNEMIQKYLTNLFIDDIIECNLYYLLSKTLEFDRNKRPNIDQILKMPYFKHFYHQIHTEKEENIINKIISWWYE